MTYRQMIAMRQIVEKGQEFSDWVAEMFRRFGIWEAGAEGDISFMVNPGCLFSTQMITFGSEIDTKFGRFILVKGKDERHENYWHLSGKNSVQYEKLFAKFEHRNGGKEIFPDEPGLPPDGLCVSVYDDHPVLVDWGDLSDEASEAGRCDGAAGDQPKDGSENHVGVQPDPDRRECAEADPDHGGQPDEASGDADAEA